MAVQAQYPSNVLLLNRNTQEGIGLDCSLQPQLGGGGGVAGGRFLDHQTHMLFSNGGAAATRKRERESSGATTAAAAAASNNIASSGNMIANPLTLQQQPQPLQLIELSQLRCNARPYPSAVVSTGLRLSSTDQHQHQQSLVRAPMNPVSSVLSSEDFAAHIRQQGDEIDQFLRAQGEQLRRTLAEKRHRHYRSLLSAAEETVARRLREKEAEVAKAARRNAELEARAAQLGVEAQVWQAKARAQEAAAASLQAQLQQAIISGGHERTSPEECGGSEAEDAESAYVDPDRVVVTTHGPGCRACRRRVAAVVLLPCRHLCVCPECDRLVHACPVCFTARESSVEVFLP